MMKAFDNFYNNSIPPNVKQGDAPGPGLQDHYIGAIASLAARFVNNSAVLGFEIMNEPQPGTNIDQYTFSSNYLYPFYKRVIQAITGVRDDLPDCPHYAYESALNESVGLQTAVPVTEYGCGADADDTLLTPTIESQDKAMISAIVWPWKNNCFQARCQTSWSLYDLGSQNGSVANQNSPEPPNRVRILSRVHPRGVIGQLQHYFYNATTSSFVMTAKCLNQAALMSVNETLVYIPRRLNSSVSRVVVINPTCTGQYQVLVANTTDEIRALYQAELTNKHAETESNGLRRIAECYGNQYQTTDAAAEQVSAVKLDFSLTVSFTIEQIHLM
ncbi:unnamed protein product [Didymodactylos carnosus]|uniref:Uncharacterized protein n=1 Tax=Didymodactylos carnosus TaxID=1234261 RepID=A0A814NMQ2_9BILA|nr:unnamed protein product [Didymodactylos carnosus]CAF1095869.1 unnamed protein product [Didymodactylos carnosus]CAF3630280.1 unnamed protein product [Didymodactylos carnosus]CAF3861208.1 unnamed protein product [Didymodactylos carnosus]